MYLKKVVGTAVIGNWLQKRRQRVCIKGRGSSWITICSRIPRGSALGPLLFFVFMNDLEDEITSNVLKFADDTTIFRELKVSTWTMSFNEGMNE